MAEKGAHLTGTAYIRPSIFEIIAQESLASTLEPAFKKILSVHYVVLKCFLNNAIAPFNYCLSENYIYFSYIANIYFLKKNIQKYDTVNI